MYKVLLIDDEVIILEGLKKIIDWKSLDCEIIGEAEDGETGLKLIESLLPDIILTDIRMPKIDGLKMISMIKKNKARLSNHHSYRFQKFRLCSTGLKFRCLSSFIKTY